MNTESCADCGRDIESEDVRCEDCSKHLSGEGPPSEKGRLVMADGPVVVAPSLSTKAQKGGEKEERSNQPNPTPGTLPPNEGGTKEMNTQTVEKGYAPVNGPPAKCAGICAFVCLLVCCALSLAAAIGNPPKWLGADGLCAFAILFGLASMGSFWAWVQVAARSGRPIALFFDKWRRVLAAEELEEDEKVHQFPKKD